MKSIIILIIAGLMLIDLFFILTCKIFVTGNGKRLEDKQKAKEIVNKFYIISALVFFALLIVLIILKLC